METFINFFMGFSTALLPAMIFITYFLHKNGHEVTSGLEKQLHATMVSLNSTRDELVTFKKRLANSEKNNIELTSVREKLQAELDQLRTDIADSKIQYTKTTVTETINNDSGAEAVTQKSPEPINVEKIDDQKEWVKEQLASVKAQLGSLSIKKNINTMVKKESFPGYVYVIANQEWLGKEQLIIRATRRLEPMDVVRGLGDDPKRFHFEVKMVLYKQNAPELEALLHKALKEKCVFSEKLKTKLFQVGVSEVSEAMAQILKTDESRSQQESISEAANPALKHAA